LIDTYRAQGHLNAENFVVMSVGKYIRIDGHLSIVHLSIVYIFSYICIHIVYILVCKYRWTLFIVYIFAYICTYVICVSVT